jgi:uncharacterized damage-inducible protein DinB
MPHPDPGCGIRVFQAENRYAPPFRLGWRPTAMSPPRVRPPLAGDERSLLVGWLELQRAVIAWKSAELSEEDAHRPVLPDSPLMTVAGLVSHLCWCEQVWFEVIFLGGPAVGPQFSETENADFMVDGIPLAKLLDEYDAQCARSNEIVAAHSLDDTGKHEQFRAGQTSLRWIVLHMIEETARHAGHLDAIRELLDGNKGYY